MYKKLLPLLISFLFVFCSSSPVFAANSPQDVITANKTKYNELSSKIVEISKEVSQLSQDIEKLKADISRNQSDIANIEAEIKAKEVELNKLNDELKKTQEIANKRLNALYKNSYSKSTLSLILTANGFSDLLTKLEATQKIAELDKKLLSELQESRDAVSKNMDKLTEKKQELEKLKNENTKNLTELNTKKSDLENLIAQFNKEKEAAAALIAENEEKLISHSISVIDSDSSSIGNLKDAVSTLKSLAPQISTNSVKEKAEKYISIGNNKIETLSASKSNSYNASLSRGSSSYKAAYKMTATAYTGGGLTSMGIKVVRDPNGLSTIAVDPSVIPLGSKVYIPGYGYAIAADTGGAIKGHKIDLYLNSQSECYQWGVRTVTVQIVAYPGEW
ncbi:Cell wall-binding protein YocH precursor [Clostridium sp. N3C]|uniref:3D domain-containing protein n=1 Tax=Clostridium sp. N3C TaxID=1776758 RepID=UPI00092E042A|nr:3D domain-containing protein [Clostridium sp. N3C]SCN24532.1 Cell wall-binding protein YocH precursor [Clostridium sp. N3C]